MMMRVIRSVISSVYINTEKGLFVLIHSPRKSITGLSQQTGLNYQSLQWCVEHLKPVLSDSYGEWTVCVLILLQDWRIHINHIPGSTLLCQQTWYEQICFWEVENVFQHLVWLFTSLVNWHNTKESWFKISQFMIYQHFRYIFVVPANTP
jgi:hypothetical protein